MLYVCLIIHPFNIKMLSINAFVVVMLCDWHTEYVFSDFWLANFKFNLVLDLVNWILKIRSSCWPVSYESNGTDSNFVQ